MDRANRAARDVRLWRHDGFHTAIDRTVELPEVAHSFNLLDRNSGNNCSRPQAKCQVNPTSGNLLVSFKLPSSGPIDPPIELFYNSQALLQPSGITYFGVGWSGLFSQQVTSDSAQRFLFLIQRATNIGTTLRIGVFLAGVSCQLPLHPWPLSRNE